nr:hypothetical protein [Chryseobacterium sp.]
MSTVLDDYSNVQVSLKTYRNTPQTTVLFFLK